MSETQAERQFSMGAYNNLVEYLDGLRCIVEAQRRLNMYVYGCEDPDCNAAPENPPDGDTDDSRLDILKLTLYDARECHQFRAERTAREGIVLPTDELAAAHQLSALERSLLEALLVEMTDLSRDREEPVYLGGVARYLGNWNPVATQAFFALVLPDSKLVKEGLVNVRRGPVADRWIVHLSQQAFEKLLAVGEVEARQTPEPARAPAADIRAFLDERGVVLEPAVLDALDLLWAEVRFGEQVLTEWGFAGIGAPRSIAALFHGPSGTGKTMTAQALADALGRELLIARGADILNKYIGETEKAIVRLFVEARQKSAVLLVDEADALVGRRGTIERAADRYLNGEVNTFLMELERHAGVVILTTNHHDLLDSALARRVRHKLLFAAPGSETRARIWRSRIPAKAPLAEDVDLAALGEEFELTGGQIANAALVAAFSAAQRRGNGAAAITQADLRAAAKREASGYGGGKVRAIGF